MRLRATWLLLVLITSGGCRTGRVDPHELDILELPGAGGEEVFPQLYRVSAACRVQAQGPLEVWLPLPSNTSFQVVQSLVFEVGPPGEYEEETTPHGDRILHVQSEGDTAHVSWRAQINRFQLPRTPLPTLPREIAGIVRGQELPAAVAALERKGISARPAQGVSLSAEGATTPSRWLEIEVKGTWIPFDPEGESASLPAGVIRLGGPPPRGQAGGVHVDVQPSYTLQEGP